MSESAALLIVRATIYAAILTATIPDKGGAAMGFVSGLIIGLVLGGTFGGVMMAMMAAAGRADEQRNEYEDAYPPLPHARHSKEPRP
jgi:hypothetical protein